MGLLCPRWLGIGITAVLLGCGSASAVGTTPATGEGTRPPPTRLEIAPSRWSEAESEPECRADAPGEIPGEISNLLEGIRRGECAYHVRCASGETIEGPWRDVVMAERCHPRARPAMEWFHRTLATGALVGRLDPVLARQCLADYAIEDCSPRFRRSCPAAFIPLRTCGSPLPPQPSLPRPCDPAHVCPTGEACVEGVCFPMTVPTDGLPCDLLCAGDSACVPMREGSRRCVRRPGAGRPCVREVGCAQGHVCVDGRCRRRAGPAASCGSEAICVSGFSCEAGRCAPLPVIREACDRARPCVEGVCDGGRCRWLEEHEACTDPDAAVFGSCSPGDECVPYPGQTGSPRRGECVDVRAQMLDDRGWLPAE